MHRDILYNIPYSHFKVKKKIMFGYLLKISKLYLNFDIIT